MYINVHVGLKAEGNVIHVGESFDLEAHAWLVFFEPLPLDSQTETILSGFSRQRWVS